MRSTRKAIFLVLLLVLAALASAQNQAAVDPSLPPPPHEKAIHLKHILVISQTKGFEHDSISDAMVAIYSMGRESGVPLGGPTVQVIAGPCWWKRNRRWKPPHPVSRRAARD